MDKHLEILNKEIDWLEKVIHHVISSYLVQETKEHDWTGITPPDLSGYSESYYGQFIIEQKLNTFDRLALAFSMAVHLKPNVLDVFFGKNTIYDKPFTEFGGKVDKSYGGFLPTCQTYLFITTSTTPKLRVNAIRVFDKSNFLVSDQILKVDAVDDFLSWSNGIFYIDNSWIKYFVSGEKRAMEQSHEFPAAKITTPLDWEDVVLNRHVLDQVNEISTWLSHGDHLMQEWGLEKMLKPGYRSLFYGPPGTGKTLTATLLGKSTNRDVYRVDLSMITSKYIGETEKNLSKLFDIAQHKDWILFFDEADALFGKRTEARSSNDRHANQQTAYLLQRIENHSGVVILASNLRGNMDSAFSRRFQSMIHFPMPSPRERLQLWKNAFSEGCKLDPEIDLEKISEDIELSGGSIINVLRMCALEIVQKNKSTVNRKELISAIRKELKKMNKTL